METAILILIKFLLSSGLMVLFYAALFRGKSAFNHSRLFLLLTPVICAVISVVSINALPIGSTSLSQTIQRHIGLPAAAESTSYSAERPMAEDISPIYVSTVTEAVTPAAESTEATINITAAADGLQAGAEETPATGTTVSVASISGPAPGPTANIPAIITIFLYAGITLTLAMLTIMQMRKIQRIKTRSSHELIAGHHVHRSNEIAAPFSVMTDIYIDKECRGEKMAIIVSHESLHIIHRHYVDITLMEIMTILFWFNPLVWFIRKELRTIHEFQVDQSVLEGGVEMDKYLKIIFEETVGVIPGIAHGLNSSLIKKRFLNMKNGNNIRLRVLRGMLVVPFLGALLAVFSFTTPNDAQSVQDGKKTDPKISVKSVKSAKVPGAKSEEVYIVSSADQDKAKGDATAKTKQLIKADDIIVIKAVDKESGKETVIVTDKNGNVINRKEGVKVSTADQNAEMLTMTSDKDGVVSIKVSSSAVDMNKEGDIKIKESGVTSFLTMNKNDGSVKVTSQPPVDNGTVRVVTGDNNLITVTQTSELPDFVRQWQKQYNAQILSAGDLTIYNGPNFGSISEILSIECTPSSTRVTMASKIFWDWNWLFWDKNTCLIDPKTGDRYMLRDIEGVREPGRMAAVNGLEGKMIETVLVFPPLKSGIKRIDFYEPDNYTDVTRDNNAGGLEIKDIRIADYAPAKVQRGKVVY